VVTTAKYQIFIPWNVDEVAGVKYCRQVGAALWFDGGKNLVRATCNNVLPCGWMGEKFVDEGQLIVMYYFVVG
jgi:hypothetical protein